MFLSGNFLEIIRNDFFASSFLPAENKNLEDFGKRKKKSTCFRILRVRNYACVLNTRRFLTYMTSDDP